jgi:hypothetical protein
VQGLEQPVPSAIQSIFDRAPVANGLSGEDYLGAVADTITWAEVDALEEALMSILPESELPERLLMQREAYRHTVTVDEFARYEGDAVNLSMLGTPQAPAPERVRSDLLSVMQRIKYVIEQEPPKERVRAMLMLRTIISMFVGMGVIFGLYLYAGHLQNYGPTESLFLVLFAGLVGGFISVQQRLQEPTNVDPLLKALELNASGFSLLLSPVIGMVFAAVLFVMMLAGIIKSDLFPAFLPCPVKSPHCMSHDFASFALSSTPDSAQSWAKLAVWAFAAGFLERLVPDILTRIAATTQKQP